MSTEIRFNKAFGNAVTIPFDDHSKFIIFSDCHRGDNSFADDFANNRNTYFHALKEYHKQGFTYIELGDGNELWENIHFKNIFEAHKNVFLLLKEFHDENRLHMVYGNHDLIYNSQHEIKKHYDSWRDPNSGKQVPLMPGLKYHEALLLRHTDTGQEIFMAHGHQADWWNHRFWPLSRLMVQILWRPLQVVGISDSTSPAKNNKELYRVERRIKKWILKNNSIMTITGHTHRPRFPEPGEIPFFNDGSCVFPRSITGIEIEQGTICLVKWYVDTTDQGFLQVVRTVLEGPRKLSDYQKVL